MKSRTKIALILSVLVVLIPTSNSGEFKSDDEVGMVVTSGNSNLKSYNGKSVNSYRFNEKNIGRLNGNYTYGESESVCTLERWDLGLKYERVFKPALSGFLGYQVEAHRFGGIDRRYNKDIGAKWTFFKSDKNESFTEGGYRHTIQKNVDKSLKDDKDSKARLYVETKHKFDDRISAKYWIEYLYNFTDTDDYLINMEPSLSVVLTSLFSLKMAYLYNYDNDPATGKGKYDSQFTTGLLASF